MWVAVVGASGAGKDTLLNAARMLFAHEARVRFARRAITRPAGGAEDHIPLTEAAFAARRFLLAWRAHGIGYGIPPEEAPPGCVTVMSLSRTVLEAAAARAPLLVAEVTAPAALLAARLAARGREDAAAIAERLARAAPLAAGLEVRRVENAGSVEAGAEALAAVVREALARLSPAGGTP